MELTGKPIFTVFGSRPIGQIDGGGNLELTKVIAEIDAEIAQYEAQISKLKQAKALLGGPAVNAPAAPKSGRGRPKGSKNVKSAATATPAAVVKKKRNLSPEGRERIAEAMKRRWAKQRGEAS